MDYEIREAKGKGLGVFAMRAFKRGDKIMVERPLITSPTDPIPAAALCSVQQLMPEDGTINQKYMLNATDLGHELTLFHRQGQVDKRGLFLTMSRVNHSCVGNAAHAFLEDKPARERVIILVSSIWEWNAVYSSIYSISSVKKSSFLIGRR